MIVDLNSEAVDGIVKSIFIQDYKGLCSDIQRLEDSPNRGNHQTEDLKNNYHYKAAMETMMEYYIGYHWKQEL